MVEYNMPKLDGSTYPATPIPGEYGTNVFKKSIYDPTVIGDGEFIKRGLEAANNAMLPDGSLDGVWTGVHSYGVEWTGYFRNGKIDSFFPSN